jgi:endopolyphosphatase
MEDNGYIPDFSVWQWITSLLSKPKKGKKDKKGDPRKRFLHKIGGPYGERYSVSYVVPSVVPNYFPTLRVFSYNISGLEDLVPAQPQFPVKPGGSTHQPMTSDDSFFNNSAWEEQVNQAIRTNKKRKKKKKHAGKRKKKYKFKVPTPPSKSAPPGPAYSPQPFTLLSYVQYFANLTQINNDFVLGSSFDVQSDGNGVVDDARWREGKHGKHPGKAPKHKPHPNPFQYEVEYNTTHDKHYQLKDLTVRSFLDLAHRIGCDKRGCKKAHQLGEDEEYHDAQDGADEVALRKGKKRKKHHPHKKHDPSGAWYTFLTRAFVSTKDARDFDREFAVHVPVGDDDDELLHQEEIMEL